MARAPNDYGTMGPQSTAPNPTQRNGMNPPSVPSSHKAVASPGPTGIPNTDPAALARRVRGGDDPAQGGPGGANRRAR
jgi:hypothetical protein